MGHTLADRGVNGTDPVRCVPSSGHTLSLRGPSHQGLILVVGVMFTARRLRCHFLGEGWWGPRHFGECRTRLGFGPASEPTIKRPWTTLVRLVGRKINTVDLINWLIFGSILLRLAKPHFDLPLFLVNSLVNWLYLIVLCLVADTGAELIY